MIVKVLDKTTNSIINHAFDYPTYPALPAGFDAENYEILVPIAANELPSYDDRYYTVHIEADVISTAKNSDGYKTVTDILTLNRRATAEILAALEETETLANNQIVKLEKQVKTIMFALNAILRQNSGLTLTNRETKAQTKIAKYCVKLYKNEDTFDALAALINAGENPNMDGIWEKTE